MTTQPAETQPEPLLTVLDIARILQISRPTIYKLFNTGRLRYVRIGAHRRVTAAELRRFLAANTSAVA